MTSMVMPRLMAWVAKVWRSRCGWTVLVIPARRATLLTQLSTA